MRRQWGVNHPRAGVVPIMAYAGRLRPKGVPFSGLGCMKGWEFHSVEVYRGVGKSLFPSVEDLKGLTEEFMAVKKSRKFPVFFSFIHKDSAFAAVKREATFCTKYVERVPFVNRRYTKGVPFLSKMVYERVRGWTSGQCPRTKLCWVPPSREGWRGGSRWNQMQGEKSLLTYR